MTEWAHLPNAGLIDAVLADVEARPEAWAAGCEAVSARAVAGLRDNVWLAARSRAFVLTERDGCSGAYDAAHALIWDREPFAVEDSECLAVQDAALALIAWPASADLLPLTSDALRTIIATCDGDVKHQAVLLLPAVIALSTP